MRFGSVGLPLRMAMSASRRRRSRTAFVATTLTITPGCVRRRRSSTGGKRNAEFTSLAVMLMEPSMRLRLTRRGERDAVGRGAHAAHVVQQIETALRQHEPAPHAFEEHDAELLFERVHLAAERRLRHARGRARLRKASPLRP